MRINKASREHPGLQDEITSRRFAAPPSHKEHFGTPQPSGLPFIVERGTPVKYEPPLENRPAGTMMSGFLPNSDHRDAINWTKSNMQNYQSNSAPRPPDDEEEPPLLEELGINPDQVLKRMKAVLFFYRLEHDFLLECDLGGPLCIVIALGFCLLLSGKPTFGYIYGLGIVGCISTYLLLNLMGQTESIDLYSTMSILGYGLLPVVMLAAASIVLSLRSISGMILSILCILWCTATASRFFETVDARVDQASCFCLFMHSYKLFSCMLFPKGTTYAAATLFSGLSYWVVIHLLCIDNGLLSSNHPSPNNNFYNIGSSLTR